VRVSFSAFIEKFMARRKVTDEIAAEYITPQSIMEVIREDYCFLIARNINDISGTACRDDSAPKNDSDFGV
jgi:hypothetical protein